MTRDFASSTTTLLGWAAIAATMLTLSSRTSSSSLFVAAHDHMGMHSLFPPMLSNYWDNGMNYWSFGSETVVTDDMVRLITTNPMAGGYLWNRHGNHLEAWEMNVTLQMSKIVENSAAEGGAPATTGLGVWFTTETPRHGDRSFFGAPNRFTGVGVTIDHDKVISVFVSDGYSEITSIEKQRRGKCQAVTKAVTISISYVLEEKRLKVTYYPEDIFYDGASLVDKEIRDQQAADPNRVPFLHSLATVCADLSDVKLNTHSYFGVTAANTKSNMARVEVQKFFVAPLGGNEDEQEERVGLKLLDRTLEIAQKAAVKGKGDVPLPAHLQDHNGFNFPKQQGDLLQRKRND